MSAAVDIETRLTMAEHRAAREHELRIGLEQRWDACVRSRDERMQAVRDVLPVQTVDTYALHAAWSRVETYAQVLEAEVQRLRDEREHVRRAACMALGTDELTMQAALDALLQGRTDMMLRILGAQNLGAV